MFTVKQLSKLAGVTPRALRYYDQIGLLKPSQVGANGYRYYDDDALLRLQQILLYRALDLPLEEIQSVLARSDFDALAALEQHRAELQRRAERLQRLIGTVEHTILYLKGQADMSKVQLFQGFSDEEQAAYEQEAMQMYDPEIVKASVQRYNRLTPAERQRIADEGNAVYAGYLEAMPKGPASPEAQACVEAWRRHMDYFWTPNLEQLVGLAEGYVNDPRFKANFDKIHPDLAEFVLAAVKVYVGNRR